jgi:septum formation inhibitor MinC
VETSAGGHIGGFDPEELTCDDIGDPNRVVTARGTERGLILRIDGKAEWSAILSDIEAFLGGRKKFFEGGEVSIEWLERLPTKEQSLELETLLKTSYGIEVVTRKKRPPKFEAISSPGYTPRDETSYSAGDPLSDPTANNSNLGFEETFVQQTMEYVQSGSTDLNSGGVTIPLFDEVSEFGDDVPLRHQVEKTGMDEALYGKDVTTITSESSEALRQRYISRVTKILGEEVFYDDDANAKVVYGTLRSGQKLETPYSLIIIGDVNPGADVTAGGDIIVLGSLRGTAHASAYDEDSFDHVIVALQMQPMQLRIGSVISRGSDEVVSGVEIARIENRRIIVEQFNPRALLGKKLR